MIIAVDFDGVIHEKSEYGDGTLGEPMPGAIEALNALHEQGHDVFIHTARVQSPYSDAESWRIRDWLTHNGVTFAPRLVAKPIADVYIDDKALRFTSWQATTAYIDMIESVGT